MCAIPAQHHYPIVTTEDDTRRLAKDSREQVTSDKSEKEPLEGNVVMG